MGAGPFLLAVLCLPVALGAQARGHARAIGTVSGREWIMPAGDFASTRFSTLDQIRAGTISRLHLKWTFATGRLRGHEGAPLVVGSTMYVVTPFPNHLFALDLRQDGAMKWSYQPPSLSAAAGVACCDVVNRGLAYADGALFFATLDNQVVAVDTSGKERWRVRIGDIKRGETITMAPLAARGLVFVGNSGGEFGVRGWLTALDQKTGKIAWRGYSTGPDRDVLIDSAFVPFYGGDRGPDLGSRSWPPGAWQRGGGAPWGWISFDSTLNLLYYGTGNASPWNPDLRPGDNKWTASIMARDPATGRMHWAYQFDPHNEQDYDAINESILIDLPWNGKDRQALFRHERNGYVYLMDRLTGEVLAADRVVRSTTVDSIDLHTGRPYKNRAKVPHTGAVVRDICPATPGSKNWSPAAFSPA
ncbi:MAG TPA: PQQ-binding-like beta-propeller repeat protein, partial [Gemmatimonadales bacterium]|nr:PQQ-binding-like beta-propeller repeat protein [Gemmatimonadales bacterium]